MAIDINWGLLTEGTNALARGIDSAATGFAAGREKRATNNALAAYVSNPNDKAAFNTLLTKNPTFALQARNMAREDATRQGLSAAYDPATGQIDPVKARGAYAASGDITGAIAFDKAQAEATTSRLKHLQDVHKAAMSFLGGVRDQASYEAAVAQTQKLYRDQGLGDQFPQLPPAYSPQLVQQMQMEALDTEKQLDFTLKQQQAARQAAKDAEDARHNRVGEATAATNAKTSQGRLGLARTLANKTPNVTAMSTADLIALAGGQ